MQEASADKDLACSGPAQGHFPAQADRLWQDGPLGLEEQTGSEGDEPDILDVLEEEGEEEEGEHLAGVLREDGEAEAARTGTFAAGAQPAAAGDPSETGEDAMPRMRLAIKAGMEGVDRERATKIIVDMSRGSRFYVNEERKDQRTSARITDMLAKARRIRAIAAAAGEDDAAMAAGHRLVQQTVRAVEANRRINRTYVHVDMDCFYAAVETRDNPSLAGKPIGIGGNAMLSTSNYEARKFGVRAAMPGYIAKKLCPDLIFVKSNFKAYRLASAQFKKILSDYDPNYSSVGLDEANLDLTDYLASLSTSELDPSTPQASPRVPAEEADETGNTVSDSVSDQQSAAQPERVSFDKMEAYGVEPGLTPVERVVREIRQRIYAKTRLTASAGIGPNPRLAKMCSDKHKPNGQYYLPGDRDAVRKFTAETPVRDVFGIGKVSEKILAALGIQTCEDIRQNLNLLRQLFSQKSFRFFVCVALGVHEPRQSAHQRKSISNERTFRELSRPSELRLKCQELAEKLAQEVAGKRLEGRTVTLKLKEVSFTVRQRSITLPRHVDSEEDISRAAQGLLAREMAIGAPLKLRLMGVRLSALRPVSSGTTGRPECITRFIKKQETKPAAVAETHPPDSARPTLAASSCCPICQAPLPASNTAVNEHVDLCLNRDAVRVASLRAADDGIESASHSRRAEPPSAPGCVNRSGSAAVKRKTLGPLDAFVGRRTVEQARSRPRPH